MSNHSHGFYRHAVARRAGVARPDGGNRRHTWDVWRNGRVVSQGWHTQRDARIEARRLDAQDAMNLSRRDGFAGAMDTLRRMRSDR